MVSSRQLGQAIKTARHEAGITQDELSDRAGLAYSTLAKIEQGAIKSPSFFTVQAIAEGLEVSIGELTSTIADSSHELGPTSAQGSSEKTIKFVYSDMNGVLVRFYHRAFSTISKETSCNLDVIETAFWHYNDAVNKGEITLEDFNKAVSKRLGVKQLDWQKHYMEAVKPMKVMQAFLEEIHCDIKIGLLTNTMPGFLDELIRREIITDINFDAIVDSSVVGKVKPEAGIYEIAEKESEHKGNEILLIDDSRTNLIAAEKLGWQVMWFDDYDPEESVKRLRETIQSSCSIDLFKQI